MCKMGMLAPFYYASNQPVKYIKNTSVSESARFIDSAFAIALRVFPEFDLGYVCFQLFLLCPCWNFRLELHQTERGLICIT